MKKITIICSTILAVVIAAAIAFDSSSTPSSNNEGLKKTEVIMVKR